MAGGTFPTSVPSYTVTVGSETANGAAGGVGLSGLLNNFETDITALATKLGTGSSAATTNAVLSGTGAGTSAWATTLAGLTFTAPVLSGSVSGTYTLAGTPTITAPILSGSITGTYTLAGTPTITSPTITSPVINQLGTASGLGAAWTSFTPSYTNLTVGNGTNTGYYMQIGKTVFVRTHFILGTTSSVGAAPVMTLPATSSATAYTTLTDILGIAYLEGNYGAVRWRSTTTIDPIVWNSAGTYVVANGVTATIPVTWGTGNTISMAFSYEAA